MMTEVDPGLVWSHCESSYSINILCVSLVCCWERSSWCDHEDRRWCGRCTPHQSHESVGVTFCSALEKMSHVMHPMHRFACRPGAGPEA